MSRNQRLGFLGIAAVIAVVAVIVLTSGSDDSGTQASQETATPTATETATATETGTATPTPTPTPTPKPKPKIPVLSTGQVKELEFTEGETIRFAVRSDTAQEVHVHGYDLLKETVPGKPITFSFKATITGIFEVEFEESGEHIGELRVDPK